MRAKGDQRSRGHPCSGPENCNPRWLGQQGKAEPRSYEIDETNRNGEANRGEPTHQVDCGEWLTLNLSLKVCHLCLRACSTPLFPQAPQPSTRRRILR